MQIDRRHSFKLIGLALALAAAAPASATYNDLISDKPQQAHLVSHWG
jgi:hypothetical protein